MKRSIEGDVGGPQESPVRSRLEGQAPAGDRTERRRIGHMGAAAGQSDFCSLVVTVNYLAITKTASRKTVNVGREV